MTLASRTLSALLEEFRSSAPTPGGGSAAALAGALGASLLTMAASLPKPRAATDEDLRALGEAGDACARLAKDLEALIDRDAAAYDGVMSAYRLPKGTDEEKGRRSARIQEALRGAIETPLDVMRASAAALAASSAVLAHANPNASSDVNVGIELLRAARRGAQLNVEINLETVKDAGYVASVRGEMERLLAQ
jgi:formiminotetrahydrofolate cyclodeaminase